MGTTFGAVSAVSTLGMALGPWAGGWLYDSLGGYFWLYMGSFGIGLGRGGDRVHVPPAAPAAGGAAEPEPGDLTRVARPGLVRSSRPPAARP